MNCNIHTDTPANGFCLGCGQPFCEPCLGEYGYCQSCQEYNDSVRAANKQQDQENLARERKSMRRRKNFSVFLLIVSPIPIVLWLVFGLQFVLRGSPLEAVIVAFVVTLPWGIISAFIRGDRNMSDTDRIVEAIQEHDAGCLFTLVKLAFALVMGVARWILSYFIVTIKAVFYLIEYRSMMKGLEQ